MKKVKIVKNFPCTCGHLNKLHITVGPPIWDTFCEGSVNPDLPNEYPYLCECYSFVPDNLKYLENRSKKRGKK